MIYTASTTKIIRKTLMAALAGAALAMALSNSANAQNALMQCADPVPQDPAKIFRSGLWKQWIYWAIPGPTAYAAVQRIVAEANMSRGSAGLPLLLSNPSYEIVLSVFDERNARGANGSSALPETSRAFPLPSSVQWGLNPRTAWTRSRLNGICPRLRATRSSSAPTIRAQPSIITVSPPKPDCLRELQSDARRRHHLSICADQDVSSICP